MASIFISHSSKNNEQALALLAWLVDEGWNRSQIFIDLHDIHSGGPWREKLNEFGAACEAVIICISDDWLSSLECVREFNYAESLGKAIFPIVIAPLTHALPRFITDIQMADISRPDVASEGLRKLKASLSAARISPEHFAWPPVGEAERSPYRGLTAFEKQDAAIFFGRDAAISRGLDAVRRLADRCGQAGAARILVVLGASGAGKSSFLQAGLIARLQRDAERFIVLPVARPGRAALSGPRGILRAIDLEDGAGEGEIRRRFAVLRKPELDVASSHPQQTIILPIDQAEELYAADCSERDAAIELISRIVDADRNFISIMTIRSDAFAQIQDDKRLAQIPREPFDLPPVMEADFKEIIVGPGKLKSPPVVFEDLLVERLLRDLGGRDSLPLLAFTLERLFRLASGGRVTLEQYVNDLGGVEGAIDAAVEMAFLSAKKDPALAGDRASLERVAQRAFIPALVYVDDPVGQAKRSSAPAQNLDDEAIALLHHFVAQRLVTMDLSNGASVFEICHEAVLRCWRELAGWIEADRDALIQIDRVRRAAAAYSTTPSTDNLVHRGEALNKAREVLARADLRKALDESALTYVEACETLEAEENRVRRKTRLLSRVLPLAVLVIGIAAASAFVAVTELAAGFSRGRAASLLPEANRAAELGDVDRALRLSISAVPPKSAIAPVSSDAAAMLRLSLAAAAAEAPANRDTRRYQAAAFDPLSDYIYLGDDEGGLTRLSIGAPDPFANFRVETGGAFSSMKISAAGQWLAVATRAGVVKAWRMPTNRTSLLSSASADCTASVGNFVTTSMDFDASETKLVIVGGFDGRARGAAFVIDLSACLGARALPLPESALWPVDVVWRVNGVIDFLDARWDSYQVVDGVAFVKGTTELAETLVALACPGVECDRGVSPVFSRTGERVAFRRGGQVVIFDSTTARSLSYADPCSDQASDAGAANLSLVSDATLNRLLIICDDSRLFEWSPPTSPVLVDTETMQAALGSDGKAYVRVGLNGRVFFSTRGVARELPLEHSLSRVAITALALAGDGSAIGLATKARPGSEGAARVVIVDVATHEVREVGARSMDVTRLRFSNDSRRLLASGWDEKVCIYDVLEERSDVCFGKTGLTGTDASWSPDDRLIATIGAGVDRPVLWESASGALKSAQNPSQERSDLWFVQYSPDGSTIATGGVSGVIDVWRIATEKSTLDVAVTLRGHRSTVHEAVFSPDSATLASLGADQTVRLWDVSTGRSIATVVFPARSVVWPLSGLVALGAGGAFLKVDEMLDIAAARSAACAVLDIGARTFSDAEIRRFPALREADCSPCDDVGAASARYWAGVLRADGRKQCRAG